MSIDDLPCTCGHDRHRGKCHGRDSYDQPCACVGYEPLSDPDDDAEGWRPDSTVVGQHVDHVIAANAGGRQPTRTTWKGSKP